MIITKTRAAITVIAASLSVAALAGPAMAADNTPTLPAGGCIVSIDGHDHTVPPGTVIMGLVCGTDGNWHLPKAAPTKPQLTMAQAAPMTSYSAAP